MYPNECPFDKNFIHVNWGHSYYLFVVMPVCMHKGIGLLMIVNTHVCKVSIRQTNSHKFIFSPTCAPSGIFYFYKITQKLFVHLINLIIYFLGEGEGSFCFIYQNKKDKRQIESIMVRLF